MAGAVVSPTVQTASGRVCGFTRNGAEVFLGIPYGASTAGTRRFLPPEQVAPWSGVRDATKLGQRAPQAQPPFYAHPVLGPYLSGGREGELAAMREPMGEDCLVLNVLTPGVGDSKRPVLFYVHGGRFTSGSGAILTLADRFVVEQDVVLVTVNHRLGALGFMYLGGLSDRYLTGNPGMLDLIAALQWVQENIGAFGGDASKVTLFGESGGGAKIALLAGMPRAEGLFRAAIIESGFMPRPVALAPAIDEAGETLKKCGVADGDLDALQRVSLPDILKADDPNRFPVADGVTLRENPWATAPTTAAKLSMIVGYCASEETIFLLSGVPGLASADLSAFSVHWDSVGQKLSERLSCPVDRLKSVIAAYRAAYPKEGATDVFFRVASDAQLGRQMVQLAELKAHQEPPVYFYRMEYDTGIPPGLRAFHTSELPLAVQLVQQPSATELSRQLSGAWAAFARSGDPNHVGLPQWSPFNRTPREIMVFDRTSRCGPDPQASARKLLFEILDSPPRPSRT